MRVLGHDKATAQHSSLGRIQQLWNEWEMQCLVLTSLALQAFLLFSAGVRKSSSSGAIRLLLWLAYLLADSLAVFVLGHLALHATTVHQLVLFWAPFLLHHLGGQETITAFSVEDNALWKRHLLSLVSQEAMAVYVAAKSWRSDDGLRLLPVAASTALMFVSGTVKYAERTYALKGANAMELRSKFTTPFLFDDPILSTDGVCMLSGYFNWMEIDKNNYAELVRKAYNSFGLYMNLLMDMPRSWLSDDYGSMPDACSKLQPNPDRACKSYMLVELQLSLIYDYLYTKIGMRQCHLNPLVGAALQAVTFISTSAALVLFMVAEHHHDYSRADVVVSYVLLVGAVVLEASSAMILVSSYWTYCGVDEFCVAKGINRSCADVIFRLVKCVRPASRRLWSGKLARYDLICGCIQEKKASVVGRAIRWIGVECDTTHVAVSGELKELVLDKLISTGANWMEQKDFVRFRGERALAGRVRSGLTTTTVLHDSVSNVDFPTSVLVWHVATDICFFSGDDDNMEHAPPHRGPSKELSDYLMYLVAKCDVLRSSSSRFSIDKALKGVKRNLAGCKGKGAGQDYRRRHAREMLESEKYDGDQSTLLASRAVARCLVNNIEDAAERWELIAAVWVEMLCYLAPRCTAKFHATHLSTGGEFVTHVRILMINLGLAWEIRPNW